MTSSHPRSSSIRWGGVVVLLALVLAMVFAAACSSQSPNIGRFYKGRILHISVADMERIDELRWTTSTRAPRQGATDEDFFRLVPASPENELVLLRVKVENHTATSAIVNVDHEAAQIRDFLQGRYFPIDVGERAEPTDVPESQEDRCKRSVNPDDHAACVKFLWEHRLRRGPGRRHQTIRTQSPGTAQGYRFGRVARVRGSRGHGDTLLPVGVGRHHNHRLLTDLIDRPTCRGHRADAPATPR